VYRQLALAGQSHVNPSDGQRPRPRASDGLETILLIEDEASVRSLVRGYGRAGYTVLEASRAKKPWSFVSSTRAD